MMIALLLSNTFAKEGERERKGKGKTLRLTRGNLRLATLYLGRVKGV